MKYIKHSPTSREAAYFAEKFSGQAREQVFLHIVRHNGATDEEIQLGLQMNPSTERPRRIELVNASVIEDSGYIRKTKSGSNGVVWVPTGSAYYASWFIEREKRHQESLELEKAVVEAAHAYAAKPTESARIVLLSRAKQLRG